MKMNHTAPSILEIKRIFEGGDVLPNIVKLFMYT